jgi:hypothetical protein
MTPVRSLLLACAAALAASGGAQAAELPSRNAFAVDLVRTCSAFGADFFSIPGTETCLRIGERVRAEALNVAPLTRPDDGIVGAVPVPGRTAADAARGPVIGLQGRLDLPQLGAGDAAWLSAAFAGGTPVADAAINPITDGLRTARGFSVTGGITHFWTPEFRSNLFGSFGRVEFAGGTSIVAPLESAAGLPDFSEWRFGANTIWSPVPGLNLGAEILYIQSDPKGPVPTFPSGGLSGVLGADSVIEGRIRIQRDF